jgi:hypothetical protein
VTATTAETREHCRRLALMLRARPERHDQRMFTQHRPENECGTAACVGGWAGLWRDGFIDIDAAGVMSYGRELIERGGYQGIDTVAAAAWLGLSEDDAVFLFYETLDYRIDTALNPAERGPERLAVAVLEHLADGLRGLDREYLNGLADKLGLARQHDDRDEDR